MAKKKNKFWTIVDTTLFVERELINWMAEREKIVDRRGTTHCAPTVENKKPI